MNPARTFGPDLIALDLSDYWVYVSRPLAGAAITVGVAYILRGAGEGLSGSEAAQGALYTEVKRTEQA
jgi:aquaporin Z